MLKGCPSSVLTHFQMHSVMYLFFFPWQRAKKTQLILQLAADATLYFPQIVNEKCELWNVRTNVAKQTNWTRILDSRWDVDGCSCGMIFPRSCRLLSQKEYSVKLSSKMFWTVVSFGELFKYFAVDFLLIFIFEKTWKFLLSKHVEWHKTSIFQLDCNNSKTLHFLLHLSFSLFDFAEHAGGAMSDRRAVADKLCCRERERSAVWTVSRHYCCLSAPSAPLQGPK